MGRGHHAYIGEIYFWPGMSKAQPPKGAKSWLRSLAAVAICSLSYAQPPQPLTLARAREIALQNHPRIQSAGLVAQAANQTVTEARAPLYPLLAGNVTGAGAQHNSTLTSGYVTTSSLYSRLGSGIIASQLVSDFGRTSSLAETARLRAAAQNRNVVNTKQQVLLEAVESYYGQLSADAVLRAAKAALDNRSVTLRQVRALAQSALKSTVDVSFAEVAVSEAELQVYSAENDLEAGRTRLAAALGYEASAVFQLADEPLPPPLAASPEDLIAQAMRERPDLAGLTLTRDAAYRFADAEKRLRYPSINLLGVAGGAPARDERLQGTYSAAAVNINIPVLNGGLFAARQAEADFRAKAATSDVRDLTVLITRDVRTAWLDANTAFRRLDVTARLLVEAKQALRLAQLRYDNGLGSIVELNQAQFSETDAEIEGARAKYDYLSRRKACWCC